jgi:iron complex transport system substrate-binding protein
MAPYAYCLQIALLLVCGGQLSAVFAGAPPDIASLNLCTDSMLLELAPRDRIAALSFLAGDPNLSPFASLVEGIPLTRGSAEEIVRYHPRLVLSGAGSTTTTNAMLARLGYQIELFEPAHDLPTFRANFLRVGALIGEGARAKSLLATLHQRLESLTREPRRESALILEPNGYVPGPETLADDLLATLGVINLAAALNVPNGGFVTLEKLIKTPPTWLIISAVDASKPALASEFLRHPVLDKLLANRAHVIAVPESLWACGGTYFADAVALVTHAMSAGKGP